MIVKHLLRSSLFVLLILLFSGCEIDIKVGGLDQNDNENNVENNTNSFPDNQNNNEKTDNMNVPANEEDDSNLSEDVPMNDENVKETEDSTNTTTEGMDQTDNVSVRDYLPMEVGYVHRVGGDVPDGFGEYVHVFAEKDNYYLAAGGSTSMGFYRLYKVSDQEAALVFETNEEQQEYYDIDSFVTDHEYDQAISYAIDHINMNYILLKAPLVEDTSWENGVILNTHVNALQSDDSIVLHYWLIMKSLRNYDISKKGVGLVGIVHYSADIQDLFGEAVYAKNIVQ
ncbi:hypothetical protein ACERII_11660 [Evansella sp. AB-rgal1]|uniref:hypothetical protein n=1 Tax=Evansella sp. AB-rgal1 TaxID=3242696 RepID=UPI00359D87FB